MHGLARKVAGLAEEVSWRSDAAMEWADGDGQRWRAMVLGVWAGRIKDGWMDGSIKIAGFDPADTRKQAEAEAELASEEQRLVFFCWRGRRCWLAGWQTDDTSDTRSGRLHIVDGWMDIYK